jgi:hypothetical protein
MEEKALTPVHYRLYLHFITISPYHPLYNLAGEYSGVTKARDLTYGTIPWPPVAGRVLVLKY